MIFLIDSNQVQPSNVTDIPWNALCGQEFHTEFIARGMAIIPVSLLSRHIIGHLSITFLLQFIIDKKEIRMSLIENLQVSLITLVMHRSNGEEINFSLQTTISETLRTIREVLIANTVSTAAMNNTSSSETGPQSPRISMTSETIPSPRRQFVQQRSSSNHSIPSTTTSSSAVYCSMESPESISNQIQALALLKSLISALPALLPDARKDIATIFTILLHEDIGGFVDYLSTQMSSIVSGLVDGYKDVNIALICGQMLRECVQYEKLCWQILSFPELLWPFFDVYVHVPQFEVASDAFSTIKEIITAPKCKNLSREFLSVNAEIFLDKYEVRYPKIRLSCMGNLVRRY